MLDKLKLEYEEEMEAKRSKVIGEAEQRAAQLMQAKKDEIDKERRKIEQDVEKQLRQERGEGISHAKIEAKRLASTAREDAIGDALNEVWKEFTKLDSRDPKAYEKLVSALADGGAKELGPGCTIYCSEDDRKFLEKKHKGAVKARKDVGGGILVESKDGKVRIDCTLKGLFEENRDQLTRRIFEKMFGKD